MSISRRVGKIKRRDGRGEDSSLRRREAEQAAVVILGAFLVFGLVRLGMVISGREPVVVEFGSAEEGVVEEAAMYVGSTGGSVYHLPWCGGARRIKEENKVWFGTAAEARAAGYRPAKNCPGL